MRKARGRPPLAPAPAPAAGRAVFRPRTSTLIYRQSICPDRVVHRIASLHRHPFPHNLARVVPETSEPLTTDQGCITNEQRRFWRFGQATSTAHTPSRRDDSRARDALPPTIHGVERSQTSYSVSRATHPAARVGWLTLLSPTCNCQQVAPSTTPINIDRDNKIRRRHGSHSEGPYPSPVDRV